MKLLFLIAWLAAALATPAVAWAGDQAYISWTLGDQDGRPTVTWKITGSTKWYVGTIQIASDRRVGAGGNFLPENVVAYEVLEPDRPPGFWVGPLALQPGTYYGRLRLRFDGPCSANCQSATSVRSFRIDPPRLRGLRWKARGGVGRVIVSWTKPAQRLVREHGGGGRQPCLLEPRGCRRLAQRADEDSLGVDAPESRPLPRAVARRARQVRVLRLDVAREDRRREAGQQPADAEAGQVRAGTARREDAPAHVEGNVHRLRPDSGRAPTADPRGDRAHRRQCPADPDAQSAPRRAGWMPLLHDHEAVCLPVPAGEVVRVTIQVRDGLGVWSLKTRKFVWTTTG